MDVENPTAPSPAKVDEVQNEDDKVQSPVKVNNDHGNAENEPKVVENGHEEVEKAKTEPATPIKVEIEPNDETPAGGDRTSSPPVSPAKSPTIRLAPVRSTESHDNPFLADGELCKKADTIIRCSTISRTELKVFDPDTSKQEEAVEEPMMQAKTAGDTHAAPRPQDVNVKQNGNVDDALTPQSVEVEVGKANASQPEAQKAEEVKVEKDKKCACCVIQ